MSKLFYYKNAGETTCPQNADVQSALKAYYTITNVKCLDINSSTE